MDKNKLPPDPASVSRTLLDTIVSEAADSPVFRCSLRERPDIIANLSSRDIRGILRNCQAPKTYFNSDTEAQEALRNYLNLSEKSDETWRICNTKSGAKRQSSLSPLVEETSPKQRTQNRPTTSASITDILDEPNLANSANLQTNSALSLAATLRNVNDGLNCTVSALVEATGLLQLVMRAEQPSKERIMESLNRIQLACSATQGLQIGLKACVDVLSLPGTVDPMRGPEQAATPLKTPIKGKTANVTSYANAVKSNRQSSNSKRSFSQDKLTRMKMAEERKKIRCDSRSIRLRPQSTNGIINNGLLVREICRFLNFKGPERDLIEEVRVDRRGCYYCQVKETFFKETLTRILDSSDPENLIQLPNLGTWKVSEPVESLSAGKKPIVIYGVSSHIQPQEFATELWESNYHRWGLNSSEKMSDHIAHPSRLNKRSLVKKDQGASTNSWSPSRNFKVFVSNTVYKELNDQPGRNFVSFDYMFLRSDDFKAPPKRCDNCGMIGHHHPNVCRRASKCFHCGGAHPASQCPTRRNSQDKKSQEDIYSIEIQDAEMEFHDCANSASSTSSLKDWEEATDKDQSMKISAPQPSSPTRLGRMPSLI